MKTAHLTLRRNPRLSFGRLFTWYERVVGRRFSIRVVGFVLRSPYRVAFRPLVVFFRLLVRVDRVGAIQAFRHFVSAKRARAAFFRTSFLSARFWGVEVCVNATRVLRFKRIVERRVRVGDCGAGERACLQDDRTRAVYAVRNFGRVYCRLFRVEMVQNGVLYFFARRQLSMRVGEWCRFSWSIFVCWVCFFSSGWSYGVVMTLVSSAGTLFYLSFFFGPPSGVT